MWQSSGGAVLGPIWILVAAFSGWMFLVNLILYALMT
jgi:hypothetical protein